MVETIFPWKTAEELGRNMTEDTDQISLWSQQKQSEYAGFSGSFDLEEDVKVNIVTHHMDNSSFCNSGFLWDANRFHCAISQNLHKTVRQK